MGLAGILDGQRMKVELGLHASQQLGAGLEQADPDDMAVLLRPFAGFVDGDVCDRRPSA